TLRNEPRREGKFMSEWMNLLGSESAEVRQEATSALCRMNGDARASVPALLDVMANDPVDTVRSGAAFAVYMISSDLKQRGTPATEAVPALAAALRDPHPVTRMNAGLALFAIGDPAASAGPALTAAIDRQENLYRVPSFHHSIREQMIAVLGKIGPAAKDAVPVLETKLEDDNSVTRLMAIRALGNIGPDAKHALPVLLKAMADESEHELIRDAAREAVNLIDATSLKQASK